MYLLIPNVKLVNFIKVRFKISYLKYLYRDIRFKFGIDIIYFGNFKVIIDFS